MSRLANKIKAGYFPTPPEVTLRIVGHLAPPESGTFRWLDPCAGEGEALSTLAHSLGGRTFGIELDTWRADEAKNHLHQVLEGDYQAQRLPKDDKAGISVLFLNPPYDEDQGRLELQFLRDTAEWLMPGGILVYIIPQHRISPAVAKRLATHFQNVQIWRFPPPYYDDFKQVVIFGVRRAQPWPDDAETLRIALAKTESLPILPGGRPDKYRIPPMPDLPFYFKPAEWDPKEVAAEAQTAGVFTTHQWTDCQAPRASAHLRPLMPLRAGHIGGLMVSGLMDNVVVRHKDGQQVLAKGRLVKVERDVSTPEDVEKKIKRTRESFQAGITWLDLNTLKIQTLTLESELREWLTRWQGSLAAKIVEQFQPLHRMNYDGLPALFQEIVTTHSRGRKLPGRKRTGLFEAQRQVVAALTRRFLQGERFAVLQGTMGTGKTTVAASLADVLHKLTAPDRPFPVVVTCPPHLVEKWVRELKDVVPNCHPVIVRRTHELEQFVQVVRTGDPKTLWVAIISSEMLKLGSGWTPAVRPRRKVKQVAQPDGTIVREWVTTWSCPRCGQTIHEHDKHGRRLQPITDFSTFEKKRLKCRNEVKVWVGDPNGDNHKGHWEKRECLEPLYQDWRGKWLRQEHNPITDRETPEPPRYPLAKYIARRYPGFFELAVVDECFPAGTPIATPDGPRPIESLKTDDLVLSLKDGQVVTRRVVRTIRKVHQGNLVRVTHSEGHLLCTPNHKIDVEGQYVRADRLKRGNLLTVLDPDVTTDTHNHTQTGAKSEENLPNLPQDFRGTALQYQDVRPERLPGTAQEEESRHQPHVPHLLQRDDPQRHQDSPQTNRTSHTITLSVEPVSSSDEFVYNLEVEDTHCYFAAGILVSNCHQYKGQTTDRGHAMAALVGGCRRTVAMTGTVFGGFATSLFYLLHRLDPTVRQEFKWNEGARWAELYGVLERVQNRSDDDDEEFGVYSGYRRAKGRVIERPGISPALIPRLLPYTVFTTLEDLGFELPEFQETAVSVTMITGNGSGPDQAELYATLYNTMRSAAQQDPRLLSEYLQSTLAYPNAPWRGEQTSVTVIPPLPSSLLYPKEEWLLKKCLEERERQRKVLVFVRQSNTRDIQPRLQKILQDTGLKAQILYGNIEPQKREAWVRRHTPGLDVLITNPKLVETGLDLVEFPTLVFFEIEYSIYVLMQASRRSWRLGQTQPVEVWYVVYNNTMEHQAIAHIGNKVAAAKLLYGDDVTGALVDQGDAGTSLLEELARELMSGRERQVPDLAELFVAQSRKAEAGPERSEWAGPERSEWGRGWLLGTETVTFHDDEDTTAGAVLVPPKPAVVVPPKPEVQVAILPQAAPFDPKKVKVQQLALW